MKSYFSLAQRFSGTGSWLPRFNRQRRMLDAGARHRINHCLTPYARYLAQLKKGAENGQALVEGLLALLMLLSLWVAIPWLARLQDMALQATHASRFAAFSLTRHPDSRPIAAIRERYFSGGSHQWADRRGTAILSPEKTEIRLNITDHATLAAQALPGGQDRDAQLLRPGWRLDDSRILDAYVSVAPPAPQQKKEVLQAGSIMSGLRQFDQGYPVIVRHTAILSGAGHAAGDADAQYRTEQSGPAWRDSVNKSYGLGRQIQSRVSALDRAWNRPDPVFDWLQPWAGRVPEFHLRDDQGGQDAY